MTLKSTQLKSVKKLPSPKQKRSIATKHKIKKVAKKLFSNKGYYAVTSNMIASACKMPIGSFYNYFNNKQDVMIELINDFNEEYYENALAEVRKLVDQLDGFDELEKFTKEIIRISVLNSNLSDPFFKVFHALQFTEPEASKLFNEIRTKELEVIRHFLRRVSLYLPIENLDEKAELIHITAENLILHIHHLNTDFQTESMIDEMSRMIYGYLTSYTTN